MDVITSDKTVKRHHHFIASNVIDKKIRTHFRNDLVVAENSTLVVNNFTFCLRVPLRPAIIKDIIFRVERFRGGELNLQKAKVIVSGYIEGEIG